MKNTTMTTRRELEAARARYAEKGWKVLVQDVDRRLAALGDEKRPAARTGTAGTPHHREETTMKKKTKETGIPLTDEQIAKVSRDVQAHLEAKGMSNDQLELALAQLAADPKCSAADRETFQRMIASVKAREALARRMGAPDRRPPIRHEGTSMVFAPMTPEQARAHLKRTKEGR